MNQTIKYYSNALVCIVCLSCLICMANNNLYGQLFGDDLDSLDQIHIQNRKVLQADTTVQQQVDFEINQHHLLMLTHEWWGIPTDLEQKRIDKAQSSRYTPYNTSLYNEDWTYKTGVFYRTDNKILPKQNLTIFGWHPHWKGQMYKTYNYKLLTHLAYFGYEVNPFTGRYNNFLAINNFISSDLIMTAHLDTCKVLLTVSNRGYSNHEIFFTSEPDVQKNLIDSLRSILIKSGADGIDLNF